MHPRAAELQEQVDEEFGFEVDIHEFPEGTKTAADAAEVIGCSVAQIASSLGFVAAEDFVVVITSGANRVSESRLADLRGVDRNAVRLAEAEEVRETLGWAIGGVPPFCHDTDVPVYMDESLQEYDTVWAAGGTPETVFPISPDRLQEYAEATPARVTE